MNWKKITNISITEVFNGFFNFLIARIRWIFLGLAIVLTAGCCYLWYFYIYHPEWSESKKQSYIQTKEAGIALDRDKFDSFVRESDNRQVEFQKDLNVPSDIFRVKNYVIFVRPEGLEPPTPWSEAKCSIR